MSDVWSGPVQLAAARFECFACGHRVQTSRRFKACPACGAGGFSLVHYGPIVEGPSLPLVLAYGAPAPRVIPEPVPPEVWAERDRLVASVRAELADPTRAERWFSRPDEVAPRIGPDPLGPLTEHIIALAEACCERTGRHGITRISLTPDVGLSFGIAPGTSVDVQTSVGRVEVYAVGALGDLRAQIDRDRADAFRIPVVIDPSMPPGTFEMRSGEQRIRATAEPEASAHDPDDILIRLGEVIGGKAMADDDHAALAEDAYAEIVALRAALDEALEGWESWVETKPTTIEHRDRIASLRTLTRRS